MRASELPVWQGSTWDRVCRDLFAGDEGRMLDWGRRYLRAYPSIQGEEFHLGVRFREIVGARNRGQWWRTAVELLDRAAGGIGEREDAVGATTVEAGERSAEAARVAETSAPPYGDAIALDARATGRAPGGPAARRTGRPVADAADRLRIFDLATERQRRRARGLPAEPESAVSERRGWAREELYD